VVPKVFFPTNRNAEEAYVTNSVAHFEAIHELFGGWTKKRSLIFFPFHFRVYSTQVAVNYGVQA